MAAARAAAPGVLLLVVAIALVAALPAHGVPGAPPRKRAATPPNVQAAPTAPRVPLPTTIAPRSYAVNGLQCPSAVSNVTNSAELAGASTTNTTYLIQPGEYVVQLPTLNFGGAQDVVCWIGAGSPDVTIKVTKGGVVKAASLGLQGLTFDGQGTASGFSVYTAALWANDAVFRAFYASNSTDGAGPAISGVSMAVLSLRRTSLLNNVCAGCPSGAVDLLADSSLTMEECACINNTAGVGGCTYVSGGCTLRVVGPGVTTWKDNSASGEGGAIFMEGASRFIQDGPVCATLNTAGGLGGGWLFADGAAAFNQPATANIALNSPADIYLRGNITSANIAGDWPVDLAYNISGPVSQCASNAGAVTCAGCARGLAWQASQCACGKATCTQGDCCDVSAGLVKDEGTPCDIKNPCREGACDGTTPTCRPGADLNGGRCAWAQLPHGDVWVGWTQATAAGDDDDAIATAAQAAPGYASDSARVCRGQCTNGICHGRCPRKHGDYDEGSRHEHRYHYHSHGHHEDDEP